jgi:hypothetical protein
MRQNETEFKWNAQREKAAGLVADNSLTDEEIAARLKIVRATLARWKSHSDFQGRVASIVESVRKALETKGIAAKQNRIDALNDRHKRMEEVIKQRATAYAGINVGGNTGLIVKQEKGIGKGKDFRVVEEYAVDTGLLRELREHEKQAAIEVGDWTEKREHRFDLAGLSDEELVVLERIISKLT